ncbi:DUF4153 domain-containing protein [Vicingus serpentipes]|uniref:DUF4153 domain-containing protein n=1 Tax=Vicingus serpentipes TaxID=1926625 RepID=A0A5C6RRH1_9FLAO|nr:DUF4153 domain-containing protein [Vicingus serpentipes]TXB64240.1 DUF4153 domain-containing protein [Vicingus serpentipes]
MQLPSINYLYQKAKNSALRFPLTLISSLLAVTIGIYLAEQEGVIGNMFPFINAMLFLALGIPLFFCLNVFTKKLDLTNLHSIGVKVGAAIILFLLYFTLPNSEETANTSLPYIRYTIYNIAIHLLVSFAPYLKGKQLNGFWQYNRLLLTRLVLSAIYSGFLYVGIALALVSLNLLFEIKIHDKLYLDLWIVIVGFFNTWFFIAGMPTNFDDLEEIDEYPFGLKVFSQYILLPLLVLYLVILYLYGAKIIALWDWPKGVVSWLIIAVAVLGIFAFLLIHPFGQKEENSWIKKFSKAYYFILLPLVIMLFIAISMRLADYGVTINRYIVLLLGVWLTIVCFYFIMGKNNIKFIPISLCVMMLLMSFGPWSMFNVSENSQAERLKTILTENGILKDGKVVNEQTIKIDSNYYSQDYEYPNNKLVTDSLNNEIKSIIDYLDDYHGFNGVKDIYSQDFESQILNYNNKKERWSRINEAEIYMKALGLEYKHTYIDYKNDYSSYSVTYNNNLVDVSGYDYMIKFNYYDSKSSYALTTFTIGEDKFALKNNEHNSFKMNLFKNDKLVTEIDFKATQEYLFNKFGKGNHYDLTQKQLSFSGLAENIGYKISLENIAITTSDNKLKLNSTNGTLFLKLNQAKNEE